MTNRYRVFKLENFVVDVQSGFASGERTLDGVVQLRMNNVSTDGNINWSSYIRVPATPKQIDNYQLRSGDIVFNSTNSPELVGKTTIFNGFNEPVVFSNHFVRLRVDEKRVDPQYLARWFTRQWQKQVFESLSTQWVNQAAVRKEDLLALSLPLPPLPEQRRIAAILGKADRVRRLRRMARELGETYLQAVFVEMFGKFDRKRVATPLGDLIDGFEAGVNYLPISEGEKASEWRVLKVSAVTWLDFNPTESKPIRYDVKFDNSHVVRQGDLLISRANTTELVGAVARVREVPPKVLLPDKLWRVCFRNDTPLNPDYALWALRQPDIRKIIGDLATGSSGSMKNISMEKAATLPIPVPPSSEQEHFSAIVRHYERLRAQQREGERQAEMLFQGVLEGAFGGEG